MSHVYWLRGYWEAALAKGSLEWKRNAVAFVPIRIDGVGFVSIGGGVVLGYPGAPRMGSGEILLQARGVGSRILIKDNTLTSNNISIIAMGLIEIGERCQIGDMVCLFDSDFHDIHPTTRTRSPGKTFPITIGNNVWLGSRVIVLKGVNIGENTVVAAGSIVTRSLPANVVAAGIPAKIINFITP